jgi:hypothetical protein
MTLLLWASFHRHSAQPGKVARPTRAFRPMGLKQGRPIPFATGGLAGRFWAAGGESADKVVPERKPGWRVT